RRRRPRHGLPRPDADAPAGVILRGALATAAVAVLIVLFAWLRASGHEAAAARLVGADPAKVSEAAAGRALRELRAAERTQPDAGPAQARGAILAARGETAAAAREFETVVAAEPHNGLAWAYLAGTLRELDPARAAQARSRAKALLREVPRAGEG
ncbi:MAG TPA: hypothetical protein VF533_18895, partial [Solirubrobacteraceae bacterium]